MEKDAKAEWIARILGVDLQAAPPISVPDLEQSPWSEPPPEERAAAIEKAGAAWAAARKTALDSLRALETAIRGLKDPIADPAIIQVRAIAANLTAQPRDKAALAELRRYLDTDDIIRDAELPNGFGIKIHLRAPLTAALAPLERVLG